MSESTAISPLRGGSPVCAPTMDSSPAQVGSQDIKSSAANEEMSLPALPVDDGISSYGKPSRRQRPGNRPKSSRPSRTPRPEKNSMHGLMRQNAGLSLFLRPLCWTDQHSKILDVQFSELPICDSPMPKNIPGSPPSKGHLRPNKTISTLSRSLTEVLSENPRVGVTGTTKAMGTALYTLFPKTFEGPTTWPELPMFFGDRVYRDAVRMNALWTFPRTKNAGYSRGTFNSFDSESTRVMDSTELESPLDTDLPHDPSGLPMVAYVDLDYLASVRKNLFRVPKQKNNPNWPVWNLQQLRAKMLVPEVREHDSYLVGLFLAMAQRHFYGFTPCHMPRSMLWQEKPSFKEVKMRIMTHDNETSDFLVYTAHVTVELLQCFHRPDRLPEGCPSGKFPGLKIDYQRVPVWPILGLKERLGRALGEDLVGEIDSENLESWDHDEEEEETISPKRKRQAFEELVNRSYEDDTEEDTQDEPLMNAKKRCLKEGPPIGMVR